MRLITKVFVEGKAFTKFVQLMDIVLAVIARWIMCMTTKTDPNKVFFHTQENRYCCNPKYICEEFRKRNKDVKLVWRVDVTGDRGGIPKDCQIVKNGTYEYYKQLFSSKYIIANSVLYVKSPFFLKPSQVVFQTWHGSLGIKRFGKKDYKGGFQWVLGAMHTGKMTDYCITNSTFVSGSLRNTYWPKTPMLEYGHPRNDIMFDNYAQKRKKIKDKFLKKNGLDSDCKFVMYGPTFRDGKNFDCYNIDTNELLKALEERFGGKWILLLRYHSALRAVYMTRSKVKNDGNVIDVTDYNDMQELMTIADVAITDYSSWIYDFVLQRKPGFIFATDISLYNNERGFCYPLETTPFPIATNNAEMMANIRSFDEDLYQKRVTEFLDDKGCVEDGHASERVVDKIFELMEKNKKK